MRTSAGDKRRRKAGATTATMKGKWWVPAASHGRYMRPTPQLLCPFRSQKSRLPEQGGRNKRGLASAVLRATKSHPGPAIVVTVTVRHIQLVLRYIRVRIPSVGSGCAACDIYHIKPMSIQLQGSYKLYLVGAGRRVNSLLFTASVGSQWQCASPRRQPYSIADEVVCICSNFKRLRIIAGARERHEVW
jgi:hypothetical protein